MTGIAAVLAMVGVALLCTPETMIVGFCCMFASFACVALDNHNHDEGR